jgi:hypothetical protein
MAVSRIDAYHQALIDEQKNRPAARLFVPGSKAEPAEKVEEEAAEDEVVAKVVRSPRRKAPATSEAETK